MINARFANPIDEKIISLLHQGKSIITVEDHGIAAGFGSALLEAAAIDPAKPIKGKIAMLGAKNEFFKHDSRKAQLNKAGVTADNIISTAKKMLELV